MTEQKKVVPVVKGIIKYRNKYLIIKRSGEEENGSGSWEFPGGKIEFGESAEEALIREIKEETAIKTTIVRILYTWSLIISENKQFIGLTYLCDTDEEAVMLSSEHSSFAWVFKEELEVYLKDTGIVADLVKINWQFWANKALAYLEAKALTYAVIFLVELTLSWNHFLPSTSRVTIMAQTVFPVEFKSVAGASIIVLITASIGSNAGEKP